VFTDAAGDSLGRRTGYSNKCLKSLVLSKFPQPEGIKPEQLTQIPFSGKTDEIGEARSGDTRWFSWGSVLPAASGREADRRSPQSPE
jgi:hypothetical protein